jgi:hypothetical protein
MAAAAAAATLMRERSWPLLHLTRQICAKRFISAIIFSFLRLFANALALRRRAPPTVSLAAGLRGGRRRFQTVSPAGRPAIRCSGGQARRSRRWLYLAECARDTAGVM